jgi:hypothetical protein
MHHVLALASPQGSDDTGWTNRGRLMPEARLVSCGTRIDCLRRRSRGNPPWADVEALLRLCDRDGKIVEAARIRRGVMRRRPEDLGVTDSVHVATPEVFVMAEHEGTPWVSSWKDSHCPETGMPVTDDRKVPLN